MVMLDRYANLNWCGFSSFFKTKAPTLPTALTDELPISTPPLAERSLTTAYSLVATDMVSARTKAQAVTVVALCTIGISLIPRLLAGTTSPFFAAVTILAYIVYKLGQLVGGKVSAQGLLNLLGLAMKPPRTASKEKGPQIEEVIEEAQQDSHTPTKTPTGSQITSQSPIEKEFSFENFKNFEETQKMADEFVQNQALPEVAVLVKPFEQLSPGQALVEEFVQTPVSSQASVLVEQFKEFNAGQDLADEFTKASLNSNPAMRRVQIMQSQTPSQEKTEKIKEQTMAEKQRMSKEETMKRFLQYQIEQQRRAMWGKAKL